MLMLETHNIAERIYRLLRGRIEDGQIALGARLHIGHLAQELGVSTTPVREALNQLHAEGLAAWTPRVGIFVVDPSPEEIKHLCHARLCVERGMAPDVIQRATPEILAELALLADQLDEDLRNREWKPTSFHALYASIPGNPILQELHQRAHGPLNILFGMAIKEAPREALDRHVEEERAICRAIAARDCPALEEALKRHVENLQALLLSHAASHKTDG
jgi:DNA-binding GntR family transcriptional regulator